ncbi:hypothetical protein RZA67_10030 [Stenotrophomonas sp. C3(2023)]|uniref:hypothetical protein n=1 Tax=Stenotrophomonas sp. C3(2023) TaxID=3080277 RepID=UPI00293D01A5|nr:hypothetical protein [Stenotrophomonas sp. C3(2023)]MDV3469067.1 hypothetical protein [Stenotrophomonas sp. C3(2023)]
MLHFRALPVVITLAFALSACAKAEPRKPPRLLTNEQGCSITIDNQPLDSGQIPVPMARACVGPYALMLPQNYFDMQTGPYHDGSFSLALEYPSLEPFKPGERRNLSVDVSIRTVSISYGYISGPDPAEALRHSYTPMVPGREDPAESLETRIQGAAVYGLTPYYVDMDRVHAYQRANGWRETPSDEDDVFLRDWFVSRDDAGAIDQVIKCTRREVTESGVEYRDGKMVKKRIRGFAECDQVFLINGRNVIVRINYSREGLPRWPEIKARAIALLVDNSIEETEK